MDLTGRDVNPFQNAGSAPTVLVFLRTDCPISNRYAPVIQSLAAKFAGRARFWLVYTGRLQAEAAIKQQLSEYGYHLPVVRDLAAGLAKTCHIQVTPEAAVFTPGGTLAYHGRIDNWYEDFGKARSEPTTHELEDALASVASGKRPPAAAVPGIGCSIADLEQ